MSVLSELLSVLSDRVVARKNHTGFGGGVYVDIFRQAVVNVTYSVGEKKLVFVGFDFLV